MGKALAVSVTRACRKSRISLGKSGIEEVGRSTAKTDWKKCRGCTRQRQEWDVTASTRKFLWT